MIVTRKTIASVLFGNTRQAVLTLLFGRAGEAFYLRQIVRILGSGFGAIQRELKKLVRIGIVTRERRGNQVYFSANEDAPIFPELKGLILKTAGIVGVIQNAFAPIEDRIDFAFIFGSFARGEERIDSDVDVMIIGGVSGQEVASALHHTYETLGREVTPTIYPLNEFVDRLVGRNHFVATVLREPKIFVIGDEDEFRSLGKGGQDQEASNKC